MDVLKIDDTAVQSYSQSAFDVKVANEFDYNIKPCRNELSSNKYLGKKKQQYSKSIGRFFNERIPQFLRLFHRIISPFIFSIRELFETFSPGTT